MGVLILIGVTGALYLINRFVFGDESAGRRDSDTVSGGEEQRSGGAEERRSRGAEGRG